MSPKFSLRTLFVLVAVAAVVASVMKIYYQPKPEKREMVVNVQPPWSGIAGARSIALRRDGWSESYLDFPPYGSADQVIVERGTTEMRFHSTGGRYENVRVDRRITPKMQEDFEDILRFIEEESGVPPDQFFRELEGSRFFTLKPDQLLHSKGNPP
jgi:hypothetical protein